LRISTAGKSGADHQKFPLPPQFQTANNILIGSAVFAGLTTILKAGCPSCRPTNSVKALKGLTAVSITSLTITAEARFRTAVCHSQGPLQRGDSMEATENAGLTAKVQRNLTLDFVTKPHKSLQKLAAAPER